MEQFTAFHGNQVLASGDLATVALAVKRVIDREIDGPIGIFDAASGRWIDIDLRGNEQDVMARFDQPAVSPESAELRGRGRPKLGVVAREVTLLPRHWEWLNSQPGGASVALRKAVDLARRANQEKDRMRVMHEAAYRFMSAMAGDFPGFEEASRALFANDAVRFDQHAAEWPEDVRCYARELGFGDDARGDGYMLVEAESGSITSTES